MKCSIVVPSMNQAAYLETCLQSLLNQEGADLEILVYDGGSEDGSRAILERHAHALTHWQSQPDAGQAAALREGFARASGELLGWVNSDDALLPGAVAEACAHALAHPEQSFFYGDAVWIDAEGRLLRPKREVDFDWGMFAYGYCYLPQPATFFRRSAYEAAGGIDPDLHYCMDYDLWHKLARTGACGHIPRFWAAIRSHPASKTSRYPSRFRDEEMTLRGRYIKCGRGIYTVRHIWHRLRRACLRWRRGSYRPFTPDEERMCDTLRP